MSYLTDTDFDTLQAQIDELRTTTNNVLLNEGNYVTAKEVSTSIEALSKIIDKSVITVNREIPKLPAIQQAINALAMRFRSYANNEEAVALAASVLPTAEQKEALDNAVGTPGIANPFILNDDPRLSDTRDPNSHAASHQAGGLDELDHDTLLNHGTISHADIDLALSSLAQSIIDASNERILLDDRATSSEGRLTDLEDNTLDDIPDGATYVKVSAIEKARIVSQAVLDALNASTNPSSTNRLLTSSDADLIYQAIGTYVTLAYLGAIDTDLIPSDDTKDLGSALKPWRDLYLSNNSLYLGDVKISIIDGAIAVDGTKVVSLDTVGNIVSANADVIASKAHADTAHDWEFIRSNTGTLPDASVLNSIVTHRSSDDHDSRYVTRAELTPSAVALTSDISGGNIPVPFNSLTGVPAYGSPSFKGSLTSVTNLPLTGLTLGDVWAVRNNPNSSQLSALYICTNYLASTVDSAYKPLFDVTKISHNDIAGRDSLDAHPQYMTDAEVAAYVLQTSVANSLKALMGISGTGSLFTAGDDSRLTTAFNHAFSGNNPHSTTAEDVGAIRNQGNVVKLSHLDVSSGQINLDTLVTKGIQVGTSYQFTTPTMRSQITAGYNHVSDSSVHITYTQKTDLTDGGDSLLHYHASDRDLSNSFGTLDARTRLTFLSEAVAAFPWIDALSDASHNEYHTLESHTDVDIDGVRLSEISEMHNVLGDGHNRSFSTSGGDNGTSTYIARSNHLHDTRYVKLVEFAKLANSAGDSSTKVHWNNLSGVPATVGDTRVFANAAALAAAVPVKVGEQVVVTNYDGSNHWGVYIAVGTLAGQFSLLTTEDMGLLYAPSNHNHDSQYMPLTGATLTNSINTIITNYFGSPVVDKNIPSDAQQVIWNTAVNTTLPDHINDSGIHMSPTEKSNLGTAFAHSSSAHLSGPEITSLTTNLGSTVYALQSTIGGNTRTLTNHLTTALNSLSDITLIPNWPAGQSITDFEELFGHNHDSQYSALGHTHTAAEITNLESTLISSGFWKEADANTWLTTKTTTNLAEGSNKYLTLTNLRNISAYTNLEDHADDAVSDKKHLTDGQRNALTSGQASITDLHSHSGYHYVQDPQITIGLTRTSTAVPTLLGKAGLIKANQVVVTMAPPANGASLGEEGEIRVGGGKIYSYQGGVWYVQNMSVFV